MTQWRTALLEDVAQVLGGGTPSRTEKSYFGGGIAWATPTDITKLEQLYIGKTKETVSETGLQNSSTKLMQPGAVLLTSRATIGFTAVATVPICTNQGFINFICGPDLVPVYLAYWLCTQKAKMIQHAGGTTFKEIARGTLRKFEIPVPPLPEQRRIVDLLSRADGIVRLRREAQKKAAELIPAIFLDMFGDPATNPKGWPVKPLGEVAAFMSGGTPPKAREDLWSGPLPWVSPKDMKVDCIADAIDHVSDSVLTETNLKLVPIGSILIVVRGMILVHTVPIAITSTPVTINQDMKALMPIKSIDPSFLLWALKVQHPKLLALVDTAAHGTKKLDTAKIQAIGIPIPPLQIQRQFIERADSVASIIAQQDSALNKAKVTFEALLARSFTTEALA